MIGSVPEKRISSQSPSASMNLKPSVVSSLSTGSPVLATHTVKAIASGQLESVLIATFIIWLLLAFMFTSARAGLIALLPTVVPVVIYFGTLGVLGISLSPTTSLIACIVIGIAVDDTIQFMARFIIRPATSGARVYCTSRYFFGNTAIATLLRGFFGRQAA